MFNTDMNKVPAFLAAVLIVGVIVVVSIFLNQKKNTTLKVSGGTTATTPNYFMSIPKMGQVYKQIKDTKLNYDKLTDWRNGPCVQSDDGTVPDGCPQPGYTYLEDWSCGMNPKEVKDGKGNVSTRAGSMFGVIAEGGFNAKGIELPKKASPSWNNNTSIVWDKDLGKYVCKLLTTKQWNADIPNNVSINGLFLFQQDNLLQAKILDPTDSSGKTFIKDLNKIQVFNPQKQDSSQKRAIGPKDTLVFDKSKYDPKNIHGDGVGIIKSFDTNTGIMTFEKEVTGLTMKQNQVVTPAKVYFGDGTWVIEGTGGLVSTKSFASGRYEVRAKVPAAAGMVWALWTWAGNYDIPSIRVCSGDSDSSSDSDSPLAIKGYYPLYKSQSQSDAKSPSNSSHSHTFDGVTYYMPNDLDTFYHGDYEDGATCPRQIDPAASKCGTLDCESNAACVAQGSIPTGIGASPGWVDCQEVGFKASDPACLGGYPYNQTINQEIDWEAPSNAPQLANAMLSQQPVYEAQNLDTFNGNSYRWTNNGGTGTYVNQVFRQVDPKTGKPGPSNSEKFKMIGDGKYHTYAFEWHTGDRKGGSDGSPSEDCSARIDYFFDGNYVGTVDAFVPTLASRFWITLWNTSNANWNGNVTQSHPPGPKDQKTGLTYAETYIDYVSITPFYEKGDSYNSFAQDQPYIVPGVNVACNKRAECCRLDDIGQGCLGYKLKSTTLCSDGKDALPQSMVPYVADSGTALGSICWEQPNGKIPPKVGQCATSSPPSNSDLFDDDDEYSCASNPMARYHGNPCSDPPTFPCSTDKDCKEAAISEIITYLNNSPITGCEAKSENFQGSYCKPNHTCLIQYKPVGPTPSNTIPKRTSDQVMNNQQLQDCACCLGSNKIDVSCDSDTDCTKIQDLCLSKYNQKNKYNSTCDETTKLCYFHWNDTSEKCKSKDQGALLNGCYADAPPKN